MTKSKILAMKPGAALDRLVAKKVMGEERKVRLRGETNTVTAYAKLADGQFTRSDVMMYGTAKHYSTDIAAAWEVVSRIQKQSPDGDIHIEHLDGIWNVSVCYQEGEWKRWTEAKTAPEAICKAALLAVTGLMTEPAQ